MTKKQLVRVVSFVLVLICCFCFLSDVFQNGSNRRNTTPIRTYYNLERDTLDVVLLGTSGIDRYWLASKAYEEQGLGSYALAFNHFPAWLVKTMAKDVIKKHKDLKLLVIDMRPFTASYVGAKSNRFENRIRIVTEALPFFSTARFEAIDRSLKVFSENVEDVNRFDLSYFFNFIKHHSRWTEDDFDVYNEVEYATSEYMGAFIHKSYSLRGMDAPVTTFETDERYPLDGVCLEYLYELFDYLDEQEYEVLFLNTPHAQSETEAMRMNSLCDILDKEGYNYIRYELDSNLFDLQKDFYNPEHMNYYGSEKFTAVFEKYLADHYEFADRRGDERYYQWEGTYNNIKKTITKWEAKLAAKLAANAAAAAPAETTTAPVGSAA